MLTLILILIVSAFQDGGEAGNLITRNEAILAGIRTLRATIEVRRSEDGGKTWKTLQSTKIVRSGQKELVKNHYEGAFFQGIWRPNPSDQANLFTPEETRTVATSPRAGAGIDHPPASSPGGWLNQWKAQVQLTDGDETYRQLLDRCRVVGISAGEDSSGPTRVLALEPKARKDEMGRRLTFSPKRSYLMTRSEVDFTDPNTPEPNKVRHANREVVDFWELGPGLTLPKAIRTTRSDQPDVINLFELRDVVCNQPIDDKEFDLPIPEGVVVVDHRVGKYHLWGKDGPARTFGSNDEFYRWKLEQKEAGTPKPRRFSPLMAAAAVACLVVIGAMFAYRRHLRRQN